MPIWLVILISTGATVGILILAIAVFSLKMNVTGWDEWKDL